jgi:hypothetical protein
LVKKEFHRLLPDHLHSTATVLCAYDRMPQPEIRS